MVDLLVWTIAILSFCSHWLLGSMNRIGWITYIFGALLSIVLYVKMGWWPFVILNVFHIGNFIRGYYKWSKNGVSL